MINQEIIDDICCKFVPANYLNIATDGKKQKQKLLKELLQKRKIPEIGFDNQTIELIVSELAQFDSNNFYSKCGVGEREGRVVCDLVKRRHYGLCHGIGRSGSLQENQPKAAGSSIINNITNSMICDFIKMVGVQSIKKCTLYPMATGMTLMLAISYFKSQRPDAKYVLWSRIDQKSCFKCCLTANLIPIIIDTISNDNNKGELSTDCDKFEFQIKSLNAANIVCIMSTSSCFSPRNCDDLMKLSILAKEYNIPHILNNAYGLQSTFLTHQIEQAHKNGRLDVFIQSTDKNLLVPVGGAILAGFDEKLIDCIANHYCGRASSSQSLDVFMTLLNLGKIGFKKLLSERKENHKYLQMKMNNLAENFHETLIVPKQNPISVAMTLTNMEVSKCSMIGSQLFTRGVSGCRVIVPGENKIISGYEFKNWGSHTSQETVPYITCAAALGITKDEINNFIKKLKNILEKYIHLKYMRDV